MFISIHSQLSRMLMKCVCKNWQSIYFNKYDIVESFILILLLIFFHFKIQRYRTLIFIFSKYQWKNTQQIFFQSSYFLDNSNKSSQKSQKRRDQNQEIFEKNYENRQTCYDKNQICDRRKHNKMKNLRYRVT